jgi:hypothetical protein
MAHICRMADMENICFFYPSCISFSGCVLMSALDMACFCLSVCASFVCLRASRQKEQRYGAAAGVASHKEKL